MPKKLTQAEFLAKAVAVHGVGRYDYSQVVYEGDSIKIVIICPKHGLFEQSPSRHSAGAGCRACGNLNSAKSKLRGQDYFIQRAREVHGEKYDYSQVYYVSQDSLVMIICPTHGPFDQSMGNHIGNGRGCPSCGKIKQAQTSNDLKLDTTGFIEKSILKHGLKYNYSKSICRGRNTRVTIICPEHGIFEQVAFRHYYQGCGCMACAREKSSRQGQISWIERGKGRVGILYLLRIYLFNEQFYKIGITYQSVSERYRPKGALGEYKYEVLAEYKSDNLLAVYEWEQSILESFAHLRYQPSVHFGGATECFSSCEEILSIFPL